MSYDPVPPFRRDFDAARDPYTARNALGIPETTGGGPPAPVGAEYVTSSSDATLTNERVLTNTATVTWDFSTPGQAKATAVAGAGPFVAKAGDTMTGDLTIDKSTPALKLKKTAATAAVIDGLNAAGLQRWRVSVGTNAVESGGNAGSDFSITRYNDAGAAVDVPLFINRSNGIVLFSAVPQSVTPPAADNSINVATTAFVQGEIAAKAPLASPTFTGDPKAPTPTAGDNDTSIATTAFVTGALGSYALLASPTFTGDPKAPTPAFGDSDTSIATTAFVATGFALTNIRKFTASGTYPSVTNAAVKVLVICKGGGGSGGGCNVSGGIGAGGGEGAECWKLTTAGALSGQTVTVGPGGAAIAANTNTSGNSGTASSIGTIVAAAPGGGGSSPGGNGISGAGGAGSGATSVDWIKPGAPGAQGTVGSGTTTLYAAPGGGSGGGGGIVAATANSGGGGGGAFSTSNGSGAGGSGVVICLEFGTI